MVEVSAANESTSKTPERQLWNLDFDVAKSIRYHSYRRSFWDRWDHLTKIVSVLTGTSVLVSIVGNETKLAVFFSFMVAASSAADVVLGFSTRARRHDNLYREFSLLAIKIAEVENPTLSDIAWIRRRRLEIEMEEPGIIGLLERRCYNEECVARGVKISPSHQLNRWQVLFSQFSILPLVPRLGGPGVEVGHGASSSEAPR